MKNTILILFILGLSLIAMGTAQAQKLISINHKTVIICMAKGSTDYLSHSNFSGENCQESTSSKIDPQNTHIWVKAQVNIPLDTLKKYPNQAMYVFGKTSSEVYLNGQLLGINGTPNSVAGKEFSGRMDVKFNVPPGLLVAGTNEVLLNLSSHHGFLTLGYPMHFIGVGENVPIVMFFKDNLLYSLPLLGILILGTVYFSVLTALGKKPKSTLLFLLMNLFALGQLFSEMSRSLFDYTYPVHDLRLLAIAICSLGFGCCLLIYVSQKVVKNPSKLWLILGVSSSILTVIFVPGFDAKTASAILVPAVFCTLLTFIQFLQKRNLTSLIMFSVFSIFTITILLTFSVFHDLLFYYIITFMLCFLFIQQAKELVAEQSKRLEEQQQIAKLQFKLEQIEQEHTSPKLRITSAGKVDVLDTNTISFCKASGDYVEIYQSNGQCILFSGSLKNLESQLPNSFLKVHRSYIVNLAQVASLRSAIITNDDNASNGAFLILTNEEKVPVSRRFMPMVRGKVT